MITKLHKALAAMCLCLWATAGSANAQRPGWWTDYDRSAYFGIRLGVNAPALFFRGVHGVPTNTLCGMNAGMVYGVQLTDNTPLFFETGFSYTEKGVRINASAASQKITYKMRYLQLPFVFKYKIDTGINDFTVQPFFGGFFACGVGGQSKYYAERRKQKTFRHKTFKRPDAGFRMGCGAAYQNFYVELSYDLGLANVAGKRYSEFNFDAFDDKIRTGCFSATVGLDF